MNLPRFCCRPVYSHGGCPVQPAQRPATAFTQTSLLFGLCVGLSSVLMGSAQAQSTAEKPAAIPVATDAATTTNAQALQANANRNAANAERLIEMLELEKSTNTALADMVAALNRQMPPLGAALKARGVDPDPTLKEIEVLVKRFQARVNWTQLKPSLNQIMQDTYSPAQLQAVVDFMNSPVMQGLPAKMAQANKRTEELVRGQVTQLTADIQRVVNKAMSQPSRPAPVTGQPGVVLP